MEVRERIEGVMLRWGGDWTRIAGNVFEEGNSLLRYKGK
jgi:hypothetical protein